MGPGKKRKHHPKRKKSFRSTLSWVGKVINHDKEGPSGKGTRRQERKKKKAEC